MISILLDPFFFFVLVLPHASTLFCVTPIFFGDYFGLMLKAMVVHGFNVLIVERVSAKKQRIMYIMQPCLSFVCIITI